MNTDMGQTGLTSCSKNGEQSMQNGQKLKQKEEINRKVREEKCGMEGQTGNAWGHSKRGVFSEQNKTFRRGSGAQTENTQDCSLQQDRIT